MRKAFNVFCVGVGLAFLPGLSLAQAAMPAPPVPGPYPLSIAPMGFGAPGMPSAPQTAARPAPAMAVPYWMQAPAGVIATPAPQEEYVATPEAPAAQAPAIAPVAVPGNGGNYGQSAAPGFFPTYRAQPVGPMPGQPMPVGPVQGPGWAGPAWVPQPYAVAPWAGPNAQGGRQ